MFYKNVTKILGTITESINYSKKPVNMACLNKPWFFKWCVCNIAYNAYILIMLLQEKIKIIFCFTGDRSAFFKLYTKPERKIFLGKMWFFYFFPLLIFLFPFNSLWSVNVMKGKQMKPVHDRNWNSPTWKTKFVNC